ncbi:MAG: hypothetical protein K9H49_13285 [Bacteroidales bacterium]|nr:hypothetical protein [Bacteroidales bacterium]MCF8391146.1 hypothetical protein [Bacteroidales bacterium]
MKKLLIIFILCAFVSNINAQNIKVRKLKKLELQEKAYFPSFGNNKNEILFTGPNYTGLSLYNTKSRELLRISDERSAGEIRIPDNEKIIFRKTEIVAGKKTTQYMAFEPANKQVTEIEDISTLNNLEVEKPVAKVNGKKIDIQTNSSEIYSISPLGNDCYYLWASISPDGTKLVFTATTHGTFITDLKGTILLELNNLNDPSWINDTWVTGMNDIDDGEKILSSEIIAVNIPAKKTFKLTEADNFIAMYPKFSPEGNRLTFSTPEGNIYIAKVRIKK